MMNQRRSELSQSLEPTVGISHERRSVLIDVFGSGCDDGEAIVGGCHSRSLDGATENVVDEGGFSGRVITHEKDEGEGGGGVGVFGEGAAEVVVEGHYGRVEGLDLGKDGLLEAGGGGKISFFVMDIGEDWIVVVGGEVAIVRIDDVGRGGRRSLRPFPCRGAS